MHKPRTARHLGNLHPDIVSALIRMHTQTVYTKDHGIDEKVMRKLVARDLIEQGRTKHGRVVWKPTAYGQQVIRTEIPRFLAARSDDLYVTDPRFGMRSEPEPVSEHTQALQSADAHQRRLGQPGLRAEMLATEAQNLARRLKSEIRVCDPESIEVASQLERIRVEIARLESLRGAA